MVAPEVVIVERFEMLVHRDHARTGGVERNRFDLLARDAGRRQRLARGLRQRPHVVGVALRGVVRIFLACAAADTPPMPAPSRPRTLSNIDTRTLSVPKSTPATIAIRFPRKPENLYPPPRRRGAENYIILGASASRR